MGISELLVFGLLIGGFVIGNHLLKKAMEHARRQQEMAAGAEPPAATVPEDAGWGEAWGRTPLDAQTVTRTAQSGRRLEESVTDDAPRRTLRSSRPALFRSRQELRSAIIAMTVLGPCRALEPPERFAGREGQRGGSGGS